MFPDELFPRCLSVKFYSKCKLEDEKSPLAEHIYIRIKIIWLFWQNITVLTVEMFDNCECQRLSFEDYSEYYH